MNKEALKEAYFSNRLTHAEFVELESQLETDASFRKEFYSELELQQTIASEKHLPLKQRLQQLDNKSTGKKRWYLYAASIVALIAIGSFFYNTPQDYQELYAVHFEPYPNIVAPTVRNGSENPVDKAFRYYNNRNYKEAIPAFDGLYKQNKIGYANFYYAMSLMADNQVLQAINALENPNWEIPERFQNQRDWYLALSYLKTENTEKAVFYLEKVIKDQGAMVTQAEKILSEIK